MLKSIYLKDRGLLKYLSKLLKAYCQGIDYFTLHIGGKKKVAKATNFLFTSISV